MKLRTHWKQVGINKWVGFNSKLRMTIYENYDRENKVFVYNYRIMHANGKTNSGVGKSLSDTMALAD